MKTTIVDKHFAEHIALPGCPQVIVTRGFAYQWLKDTGYDESARGFGSIDYMVHAAPVVSEPLTDLESVASFLAYVRADLQRRVSEVTA